MPNRRAIFGYLALGVLINIALTWALAWFVTETSMPQIAWAETVPPGTVAQNDGWYVTCNRDYGAVEVHSERRRTEYMVIPVPTEVDRLIPSWAEEIVEQDASVRLSARGLPLSP